MNEVRKDCEFFEMKRWPHDCGDCQTDGHYLCGGCSNIAPFEEMELSDNRMRYYENQEKQLIKDEEIEELYKRKAELLDEYGIFGGGEAINLEHTKINQRLESLGVNPNT